MLGACPDEGFMAYRFKTDEPLAKGFRRIASQQIGAAEKRLDSPVCDPVQIHEARKNLKRTRALLRLVRPVLGEVVFKRENARLRDVGRMLSARRDIHVIDQTLLKIEASHGSVPTTVIAKLREAIAATREGLDNKAADQGHEQAAAMLRQSLTALRRTKLEGEGFDLIRPGLKRSYAACRSAFKEAYAQPCEESSHEWRKTIQHHWRQMLLLSKAWPEAVLPRARAARQISELLGEDHDIALLLAYFAGHPDLPVSARGRQQIEAYCTARQAEIRAQCQPLGARLLAERAKDHCHRIGTYWEAAGKIAELTGEPDEGTKNGHADMPKQTADKVA